VEVLEQEEAVAMEQQYPPGKTPELANVAEFERYWTHFFKHKAFDDFEVQRGLNNCFAYDLVPTVPVLEEALRACRRHHALATAVRLFGALRDKVYKEADYDAYVQALGPLMDELGVVTPEELGRFD
jgi:cytochrome c oxidase subunit 5a